MLSSAPVRRHGAVSLVCDHPIGSVLSNKAVNFAIAIFGTMLINRPHPDPYFTEWMCVMQFSRLRQKWIPCLVVLLLTPGITTPVLADYLGPDRPTIETLSLCETAPYGCQFGPAGREDSSAMDLLAGPVDTVSPDLRLDVSGASGANGWYVSPTILTATGADATSGLAGVVLSVDDGAWQPTATLNEGVYDIALSASDFAGNTSHSSAIISIDTTTPSVKVSVNGTAGRDGLYRSNIQVSALASDATSGVRSLQVSVDGRAYQNYRSAISFGDGSHTVQFRATDLAGNITETPIQLFYVETAASLEEPSPVDDCSPVTDTSTRDFGRLARAATTPLFVLTTELSDSVPCN